MSNVYLLVGEAGCYHCGPSTVGKDAYELHTKMAFLTKEAAESAAKRMNEEIDEWHKEKGWYNSPSDFWKVLAVETDQEIYLKKDLTDAVSVTLQGGIAIA